MAYNGRFGPYVKCGEETRSLPADVSPLDVTLEQALELLAAAEGRAARFRRRKEPLKVFDESPVTGSKMQLLDGRYGLYVTDGVTNASVPKGTRRLGRSARFEHGAATAERPRRRRAVEEKARAPQEGGRKSRRVRK